MAVLPELEFHALGYRYRRPDRGAPRVHPDLNRLAAAVRWAFFLAMFSSTRRISAFNSSI
jgi:hypothetical protein